MSDITDRKPLVDRAKDWCADAQVAHTYGVGIRADLSTIAMVRELVAEVERLREQLDSRGKWNPEWGSPYDVMGDVL